MFHILPKFKKGNHETSRARKQILKDKTGINLKAYHKHGNFYSKVYKTERKIT